MPFDFRPEKEVKGVFTIEPTTFCDERGWFIESFKNTDFIENGIEFEVCQVNHSFTRLAGTLRGLHLQKGPSEQGKLVRCLRGSVFDVAVDVEPSSATFKSHVGQVLSSENRLMMWIPPRCAHGFQTLGPDTEVEYLTSSIYDPFAERSIRWNDTQLDIQWPLDIANLSEKDANALSLTEFLGDWK